MTTFKICAGILLVALFLRICIWPPEPIHIEEVKHSASGVEYVCIYESRDDYLVAKIDESE